MAETYNILKDIVNPLPRQTEFLKASLKYRYLLFGGTRGCTKSRTMRGGLLWRLGRWAAEGHRGVRVGLFCETYNSLRDRQISKIKLEFPEWLGKLENRQTDGFGFYMREEYGGGAILLRNLDDVEKYQGAEFAAIAVDELTRNKKETFDMLRGSLRWPGIEDTFFWGATTALGIGLPWVRSLWIERDFPPEMQNLAPQFFYVQAFPDDNPYLTDEYWNDLRSQPKHIQAAWIHCDWYSVAGSMFEEWRRDLHLEQTLPPETWHLGGAVDWGYRAPGCFGLYAAGPDGDIVKILDMKFQKRFAMDVGREVGLICKDKGYVESIVGDSQMWQAGGINAPTIAEEFQRALQSAYYPHADRAPVLIPEAKKGREGKPYRHAKCLVLHEYLGWQGDKDGKVPPWSRPKLRFMPACKYTISSLPALPADESDPEDVDTDAEDHAYDETCAYLMSRPVHPERRVRETEFGRYPGLDVNRKRRKPRYEHELEERYGEQPETGLVQYPDGFE